MKEKHRDPLSFGAHDSEFHPVKRPAIEKALLPDDKRGHAARLFSSAFVRAHSLVAKEMAPSGMSVPQMMVLVTIKRLGRARLKDMVEFIGNTTKQNISALASKLEAAGHVSSQPAPDDKRARVFSLTKSGLKLVDEFSPVHIETIRSIFEPFAGDELDNLINYFTRMLRKIKQIEAKQ